MPGHPPSAAHSVSILQQSSTVAVAKKWSTPDGAAPGGTPAAAQSMPCRSPAHHRGPTMRSSHRVSAGSAMCCAMCNYADHSTYFTKVSLLKLWRPCGESGIPAPNSTATGYTNWKSGYPIYDYTKGFAFELCCIARQAQIQTMFRVNGRANLQFDS